MQGFERPSWRIISTENEGFKELSRMLVILTEKTIAYLRKNTSYAKLKVFLADLYFQLSNLIKKFKVLDVFVYTSKINTNHLK